MKQIASTLVCVVLGMCSLATAADGSQAGAAGWALTTGQEFPGAQGTLSVAEAKAGEPQGKVYTLVADFRNGGAYVGMTRSLEPSMVLTRWSIKVKTPAKSIAVRVTDAMDQTHQRYIPVSEQDKWVELAFTSFGTQTEGSHWGGPGDGVFRGPAKAMGVMIQKDSGAPAFSETLIGGINIETRTIPVAMTPDAYFVEPGSKVSLRWPLLTAPEAKDLSYTIRSYDGTTETTGTAAYDAASGYVTIETTFTRGYHELEMPALTQAYGVLAQPAMVAAPDPFFAIDSALSILEERQPVRDGLIRALRRSGIATARERLYWTRVNSEKGKWNWSVLGDDVLRARYQQSGVSVLEAWHDAPRWAGAVPDDGKGSYWNPYPQDLAAVVALWGPVAKQWEKGWAGVEAWNEPEGFFGGNFSGDQVSALTKAVSYAFSKNKIAAPLVGGVLAGSFPDSDLLSIYFDNGILEDCDAFSFHNYGPPVMVEKQVAGLRGLMKGHANGSLPFLITESGRAWKKGPPRAKLEEDRFSALEVTMKGVEARACGVAKYFPFVYCYYGEGDVNWGMMGKEVSPMRSMAAYANSAVQLAGMQYVGDWSAAPSSIVRARAFANRQSGDAVMVLYTGKTDAVEIPAFPFKVTSLAGIDGRPVVMEKNRVIIDGGILYVHCRLADLSGRLRTNTTAMTLWKIAQGHVPQVRMARPVVLQPEPTMLPHNNKGYCVTDPAAVELVVKVHNLADKALVVAPKLKLPAGVRLVKAPESQQLSVDGQAVASIRYVLNFTDVFGQKEMVRVGLSDDSGNATPISISFLSKSTPIPNKVPLWHTQADEMPALTPEALAAGGWIDFSTRANWIGWDDSADGKLPIKGHLRLSWTEQALRVEVLVEDKYFHQPFLGPEMWNGDSVQVAFQNRPDGKVADKFTEIIAGMTKAGPQLWRGHAAGSDKTGLLERSTLKFVRQGDYHLYVITLQAGEVDLSLAAGRQLGLSLIVNENDGSGRLGWLEWGGGIGSAKMPSEYKALVLAGT